MKTMKDFKGTIGNFKMDINHQTHVTGAITICVGNPETGDVWAKVGEASKQSTYAEVEANARLFANAKKVLEAAIAAYETLKYERDVRNRHEFDIELDLLEKAINDSL